MDIAASKRFDRLGFAAMQGIQAAEPDIKPGQAYAVRAHFIADLTLSEDATAENKTGAAKDIADWLVKWVIASTQDRFI